jgi:hypothetical protein
VTRPSDSPAPPSATGAQPIGQCKAAPAVSAPAASASAEPCNDKPKN